MGRSLIVPVQTPSVSRKLTRWPSAVAKRLTSPAPSRFPPPSVTTAETGKPSLACSAVRITGRQPTTAGCASNVAENSICAGLSTALGHNPIAKCSSA